VLISLGPSQEMSDDCYNKILTSTKIGIGYVFTLFMHLSVCLLTECFKQLPNFDEFFEEEWDV